MSHFTSQSKSKVFTTRMDLRNVLNHMVKHHVSVNGVYLLFLLIFLSSNLSAQITFEKGYFFNNSGTKIDCFIKNIEWRNNPTKFRYRLTEDGDNKTATIDSVMEFGIINSSQYKRVNVKIDRSSRVLNELSHTRNAVFKDEILFLKVLIEGKFTLYEFRDGNLERYFYQTDSTEVEQLVYKQFLTPNGAVNDNEQYKQQLRQIIAHEMNAKSIFKLKYTRDDLVAFFKTLNRKSDVVFTVINPKQKRKAINLILRPGIRMSSLTIENTDWIYPYKSEYDNALSMSVGFLAEHILPFNKGKWALDFEATYQSYKANGVVPYPQFKVDYSSVELSLGIKHNFFFNNQSKLFITGSIVVIDRPINDQIGFLYASTGNNLNLGVGFAFQERYSVEFGYGTNRQILQKYMLYSGQFQSLSLTLGYAFN